MELPLGKINIVFPSDPLCPAHLPTLPGIDP